MRYRDLSEAPIADFQYIDNSQQPWIEKGIDHGPTGDSFRDDDKKALQSLKWQSKLIHQFRNVQHPVNLYAVNQKFIRTYVNGTEKTGISNFISDMDVWSGDYDPVDFHKTFGFLPPNIEASLNFVLLQNEGDERIPLTPWMVGHRMVHALLNDNHSWDRRKGEHKRTGHYAFDHASMMMAGIRSAWGKLHGVGGWNNDTSKEIYATVSTLTSARNHKIERPGEFFIELFTQYLFTGDFKIDLNFITNQPDGGEAPARSWIKEIRRAENATKTCLKETMDHALGHLIVF